MITIELNDKEIEILLRALAEELRFQKHILNHHNSDDTSEIAQVDSLYKKVRKLKK